MAGLPRRYYTASYGVAAGAFLQAEVLALLDPDRRDTLTEHVRPAIQRSSFLTFMTGGLLAWLAYHFLLEGRQPR